MTEPTYTFGKEESKSFTKEQIKEKGIILWKE